MKVPPEAAGERLDVFLAPHAGSRAKAQGWIDLGLVRVNNDGIAFGALGGGQALVIVVVAAALAGLVVFFALNTGRRLVWLPTGLLLGGAAGNLIDRIRLGAVTDFIKFPHWPAFNVADICVTFGVLSLIYVLERVK